MGIRAQCLISVWKRSRQRVCNAKLLLGLSATSVALSLRILRNQAHDLKSHIDYGHVPSQRVGVRRVGAVFDVLGDVLTFCVFPS